ncbi:protein of unknown function [Methanoculleus bourgensis]|uniref:Uncharacterized protein n=1 Tax=Methanoculleus bourgensis TaxID=83986 RepID=A0A0X3BNE6_9EURY|nr:protein of unknown function [Methanoculleus bourgensis]
MPRSGLCGEGARPIYANLTSRYSYPASVLVYFNHLAWSLPVAFCKIFCNEIPAFETFTQRQNRIYCAPEQTKCKRCLPPQIRLGGIFSPMWRATIPLPHNPCEFIYVSTEGELSSEEGKSYQAIPLLIVETSVKHGERPD